MLLGQLLRIAPGEAAARLRAARDLAPRRGLTGEALPAIFPAVGAALAAGELNPAHARLIGTAIDAIPAEVEQAALGRGEHLAQQVEATLVAQAGRLDPRQLGHVATRLFAHLDPDGAAPGEEEPQRRRSLDLHTRPDGTGLLRGELTPETAAVWRTVLDALSRPAPKPTTSPTRAAAGSAATTRYSTPGNGYYAPAPARRRRHPGHPAHHPHRRATGHPHRARVTDTAALPNTATSSRRQRADGRTAALTSSCSTRHGSHRLRHQPPAGHTANAARWPPATAAPSPAAPSQPRWISRPITCSQRARLGGHRPTDNLTLLCGHHHRSFESPAGPAR